MSAAAMVSVSTIIAMVFFAMALATQAPPPGW